jgi:hypothetical protein
MSKRVQAMTLAAIVLAGVGFWIWSHASQEERAIRARLTDLAREFNAGTTDGIGTVARVARISQFFTSDVVVELGKGSPPIDGRETLMGMAARLQPRTAAFVIELNDVNVSLRDSTRAEVILTLLIRRRSVVSGEESLDAREFAVEVRHSEGDWRINRVSAIDTFR